MKMGSGLPKLTRLVPLKFQMTTLSAHFLLLLSLTRVIEKVYLLFCSKVEKIDDVSRALPYFQGEKALNKC